MFFIVQALCKCMLLALHTNTRLPRINMSVSNTLAYLAQLKSEEENVFFKIIFSRIPSSTWTWVSTGSLESIVTPSRRFRGSKSCRSSQTSCRKWRRGRWTASTTSRPSTSARTACGVCRNPSSLTRGVWRGSICRTISFNHCPVSSLTWCQCYKTFFPSSLTTRPNKLEQMF